MAVKKTVSEGAVDVTDLMAQNETFKQQNEALQKQMNEMQAMMQAFMAQKVESKPEVKIEEEIDYDIPLNKVVKVISTTYGGMTLFTASTGGKSYRFNNFGDMQPILYSDLLGIISNHSRFAQEGYFMILDAKVVMASGLSTYYDKLLTKERILGILELPEEDMLNVFNTTTKHVKETILETVYKKIGAHETIDRNKINALSQVSGKDIFEMAEVYNGGIKEVK